LPTSLGVKEKHYPKSLPERATNEVGYCGSEIMFIFWTVHASLIAASPTLLIPLPATSNGRETRGFAPTTDLHL
jgi:hypothetical protein